MKNLPLAFYTNMLSSEYIFLITLSVLVFTVVIFLLPIVRKVVLKLQLTDEPNERSSHSSIVPAFGGVAFYIGLLLTFFLSRDYVEQNVTIIFITSSTIIFLIGLRDDLKNLSPLKKLLGQIVAISLLLLHSDFVIHSFHGFLGIQELSLFISFPLCIFLLLANINAYNLIDGIDGMASIIGIIIASTFGLLFFYLELYYFVAICIAIISILGAFLRFNFSSNQKLFMGDTGSLLIGLILGALSLKLLSLGQEIHASIGISRKEIPLFVLSTMIIPAFDVARVIFIRLKNKKRFFHPDRNHIHHILIDAGMSHKKASIIAGLMNIFIIGIMYLSLRNYGLTVSINLFLFLILCLVYIFFVMDKKSKRAKVKVRNILFTIYQFVSFKKKESINHKSIFKQKLKAVRFLFF